MKRAFLTLMMISAMAISAISITAASQSEKVDYEKLRSYYANDYKYLYPPSDKSVVYGLDGTLIQTVSGQAGNPVLYSVSGIVAASDGSPITSATIVLDSVTQKTNDKGSFKFIGVRPGKYDMAISANGFDPKTVVVEVKNADTTIDISLEKSSAGTTDTTPASNMTATPTPVPPPVPTKTQSPGFSGIVAFLAMFAAVFYLRRKR